MTGPLLLAAKSARTETITCDEPGGTRNQPRCAIFGDDHETEGLSVRLDTIRGLATAPGSGISGSIGYSKDLQR